MGYGHDAVAAEARYLDAELSLFQEVSASCDGRAFMRTHRRLAVSHWILFLCLMTVGTSTFGEPCTFFRRGDSNDDMSVDLSDVIFTLRYKFRSGEEPVCMDAADSNDDGRLNIADSIYMIYYFFGGVAEIPAPVVDCGADPTPDIPAPTMRILFERAY